MIRKHTIVLILIMMVLFIYPGCSPSEGGEPDQPGDVWINPESSTVAVQDTFSLDVFVNSGIQMLVSYGFEITYEPTVIEVRTGVGINGVEPGTDGL